MQRYVACNFGAVFVDADALKEIGPKLQLEKSRATMGGLCGVPIKNSANLVNDIGHL